jgi:alanine racemase
VSGAYRPTRVRVDLDAIRHNVRTLKPADAEMMAVVKADGYGHGAAPVARAALQGGATWLGVALVEEGIALRAAGIEAPVLVLSELPPGSEPDALAAGLTPTLYSDGALAGLREAAGHAVAVHVKVDTGMHRVGVYPPEATGAFLDRVVAAGLQVDGLYTHLARSEEDAPTTQEQLALFLRIVQDVRAAGHVPRLLHAANTGATILHPATHLDLVRCGIGIYGLEPGPGVGADLGLQPALSLRSAVTMVKRLPQGDRTSYGHAYRLERDAWIATVPVGYADGYPRRLSSVADVLIGGRRCRVAGSVTMDQLIVDCGDLEPARGDEVVLIGRQGDEEITAAELADLAGTINYEIVTRVGPRVPREYATDERGQPESEPSREPAERPAAKRASVPATEPSVNSVTEPRS